MQYIRNRCVKMEVTKMAKKRVKQRANRKLKNNRPSEKHSFSGYKDLTAYNAIRRVESKGKADIVLK